jgi:hypothetical protein
VPTIAWYGAAAGAKAVIPAWELNHQELE